MCTGQDSWRGFVAVSIEWQHEERNCLIKRQRGSTSSLSKDTRPRQSGVLIPEDIRGHLNFFSGGRDEPVSTPEEFLENGRRKLREAHEAEALAWLPAAAPNQEVSTHSHSPCQRLPWRTVLPLHDGGCDNGCRHDSRNCLHPHPGGLP